VEGNALRGGKTVLPLSPFAATDRGSWRHVLKLAKKVVGCQRWRLRWQTGEACWCIGA